MKWARVVCRFCPAGTLKRVAQALQVPVHRLFTDDDRVPKPNMRVEVIRRRRARPEQDRELGVCSKLLSRRDDKHRGILIDMASKMANSS